MPITPFHFGPAALLKYAVPRHFSFFVFFVSQVYMDLEPYYFLVRGEYPEHRLFHTWLGCHIPLLAAALSGPPLYRLAVRLWKRAVPPVAIRPRCAFASAAIGAYSHVLLDGLMHADMRPFFPFSDRNPMLNAIDVVLLHALCVLCAMLAAALYFRSHSGRRRA